MNTSLRKILSIVGAFVLMAGTSTVLAQLPQAGGPYTADSNTVILMHFDGADSLAIEAGNEISHPAQAIPYSEDGGLSVPDSSVSAEFGGSLYLENDTAGSKGENALYNFIAIPHFEGGQYPVPHEQNESDGVHYEAQSISGDMTVEYWFRIEEPSVYGYHTVINKAGNEHQDGDQEVDPFHWQFWHYNYNLALIDGGRFQASWANPGQSLGEFNTDTEVWQPDRWYHHSMIKDTSARQKIDLVFDRSGNLIHSEFTTLPTSHTKSDTIIHNDILVGANPHYTIGDNNYPTDPLGDASALGNRLYREFYGNLDELRISNTVREYQGVLIGNLYALEGDQIHKPEFVSNSRDSIDFSLHFASYGDPEAERTVTLHYDNGSGYQDTTLNRMGEHRYGLTMENFQAGNTINYYVTASIGGNQVSTYPEGASDGVDNLSFFVDFPPKRALKLSFERGETPVEDSSSYDYDVEVVGDTTYDNYGFDGTWSYRIGANNQLAVRNAPALASDDFTVDMWFRPTDLPANGSRLIAKESSSDPSMVNYSIYFDNDGELWARASGTGDIGLDTTVSTNNWYRVMYMKSQTAHSLQLWNANGELLAHAVESVNGAPVQDNGPLFIGQGNHNTGVAFNGQVDGIEIHNYPAKPGPFVVKSAMELISKADTASKYTVESVIHNSGSGQVQARVHYRSDVAWTFQNMNLQNEETGLYRSTMPSRTAYTVIPYYYSFHKGPYEARWPEGAGSSEDSSNYSMAVYEAFTKVLDIDFEEMQNGLPVDNSSYSEFHDMSYRVEGGQAPTFSGDAAQGNRAMQVQRQDSSYLSVQSKFLNTDEVTVSMWFKPTDIDPEFVGNDNFAFFQSILMLTKYQGSSWSVDNSYDIGLANEPLSGEPTTMRARARTVHNNDTYMDMDSTLQTGQWYHVIHEYSLNDTAFTQVYNSSGELIEEVGMDAGENHGTLRKANTPVTIGSYYFDASSVWGGNMYSGLIDDVEIYNYAVHSKPPRVAGVTTMDSATVGNPISIEAKARRNGNEEVYLVSRTMTGDGATAWDSTEMAVDFTDVNYSAELTPDEPGTVIEYWVGTQNDYGIEATSSVHRVPVFADGQAETLKLTFENGSGSVADSSMYGWNVLRHGHNNGPSYTENAIKGDYAMMFNRNDSTYLEIETPHPFMNYHSFTLDMWYKSFHSDDGVGETNNNNVRLVGKETTGGSWWQQNFEIKGIGGGSWTFGGYMPDTTIGGSGYLVDYFDDTERFGGLKDQLADSTWYHMRYIQDAENDSVHVAVTTSDGGVVADYSASVPGIATKFTEGNLKIGHVGPESQKYFHGIVDHVLIRDYSITNTDIPAGRDQDLPDKFSLGENYPNPFNPTTTIQYALPKNSDVTLKVYNLLGREVATLVNSKQQAGRHQVKFDAGNLASGVYFYRIETPEFNKVRKMMLIK